MLSKKTQYAYKALIYLAQQAPGEPILIADIAKVKKIPLKFLEGILLELKKAGILDSKKGKGGGYYFKMQPNQVTMAKVYRLIDGPIALLPCVSINFYEQCKDCDETTCGLKQAMREVRDAELSVLDAKTIADIAGIAQSVAAQ
jgi:Rrf2 family protein